MKKYILFFFILFVAFPSKSQGLNRNASNIKANYPSEYENTLKKYALSEWGDDFSMVVFVINKEADAIVELIDSFKTENTKILYNAIKEWSREGYVNHNVRIFDGMTAVGLNDLLKMHCDWDMVKFVYNKQVEAKNSF